MALSAFGGRCLDDPAIRERGTPRAQERGLKRSLYLTTSCPPTQGRTISKAEYEFIYGSDDGDRIQLADTNLVIELN